MTSLPDRFVLHDSKISKSGHWVVLVCNSCLSGTCSIIPGGPGLFLWNLDAPTASVSKVTNHPWGHMTEGFDIFVNQNGDPGINLNGRRRDDPENQFPLNTFSYSYLPNSLGFDIHPSWNYNDGSDTTPICTATISWDWPYLRPWENEVVCFGTNTNADCGTPGHGLCRDKVKRFFHTYNPATCNQNTGFSSCFGIGALSSDGRYYAFTSNWGNTLGSITSGGHGANSCMGGFNFQVNHAYKKDDIFEPFNLNGGPHPNSRFNVYKVTVEGSSTAFPTGAWPKAWLPKQNEVQGYYANGDTILPLNVPNNPCNHAFQVTAGGGNPSGSQAPIWKNAYGYNGSCNSVTTGTKVTDGSITWTDIGEYVLGTMHLANLGQDNCRSDVFIGVLN